MKKIKILENGSGVIGKLPKGCLLCEKGAKMVLLITGICNFPCFYCPLSFKKKGKDVIYANEKLVKKETDLIEEAEKIDALGTGITGGDPIYVFDRTINYIKILKENFGIEHHIHLYTASIPTEKQINSLTKAGLDEIRFHIPIKKVGKIDVSKYKETILQSKKNMDVGVEIPVLPKNEKRYLELINSLDKIGIDFLNLNELEYSERNYKIFNEMGYDVKDDISSAVKGSEETALNLMETADVDFTIHYCSSSFKDGVQLRNRIMRRVKNVVKDYEIITEEGLLLKGIVEVKRPTFESLKKLESDLVNRFSIPENLIHVDIEKNRVEIASWILEEISKDLDFKCFIVEEYPTADRLEVERLGL